jgi:hypothetical protein|tara:strand:+ start:201 stop:1076 length:876 start_codon:yes stop_codon:yes gene_type:complete
MSFGIDHPLVAVADLDVAAERAAALGFTLNPRHSHPWGTDNHLLFLHNNFIELIGIAHPELTDYRDSNGFQFAKVVEDRLAIGEGIAMVALESEAMSTDHALLTARGFEGHSPIEFRRLAHLASGDVEVGVALNILHDPQQPFLTQFLCQQLRPELFRTDPTLERHANTATSITDIWYVSDSPARDLEQFRRIHGDEAIQTQTGGFKIHTDKGVCHLLSDWAIGERFEMLAGLPSVPARAVALTLACEDIAAAINHWQERSLPFAPLSAHEADIPPEVLGGTVLRFSQITV